MKYYLSKNNNVKRFLTVFFCSTLAWSYAQQNLDSSNFKAIKLEEALQLGVQNNKQLKIANADIAIANENLSQSKIAKVPRIGLNMNYNYIGNPKIYEGFYEDNITVDYFNNQSSASLSGSMPIYNGGAIKNKIKQQELISKMKESVVKMTESEIKLAIVQQYFSLEKSYRQIEVTKQNIFSTDLRIKQLQSKVSNGQNLKSDLLRTELQQSRFKVAVLRQANNIQLISNYLDILIGLPTDTILKPESPETILPTENIDLQNSLAEAYKNRVEVKQAEMNVELSESSLRLTKSGFRPNINANVLLNTQYPAQWPDYPNILSFWAAGVTMNWDISSIYNLKNRVSAGKFEKEKSNTALEMTKEQIDKEVKTSYVRFIESKENIKTFNKDVELSLSNYKIVKSRYDNDFALISDMVDAELQVNEAKISLINANLDSIIQYYSLQFAMGKL